MSPRNTAAAIIKMLKETSCHKLITTQETLKALISEIKLGLEGGAETDSYTLEILEMPLLSTIFPRMGVEAIDDPFEEYPKAPTRPSLSQTLMYLHSSGSTGLPKSIKQSFRMICNWASLRKLYSEMHLVPSDHENAAGLREVKDRTVGGMALPAFHTLGFASQVLRSTYGLCNIALYPPIADATSKLPVMPTPDNIIEHARRTGCEDLVGIPALFQVWVQQKETVDYLASLKLVVSLLPSVWYTFSRFNLSTRHKFQAYSGGPLPSEIGQHLVDAGVKLVSIYGGTEFGAPAYATRQPPRTSESDHPWEYMTFDENINVHFEPQGDGTYELQFMVRSAFIVIRVEVLLIFPCAVLIQRHETKHDLPVENMGNGVRGYATSDLWIPHPSAPGFWKL